jgi:aminobenzoyl-glutamate transport protein
MGRRGHGMSQKSEEQAATHKSTRMERLLDVVERVGNKVPHPAAIFVILMVLVILLSHLFHVLGASVTYQSVNPETDKVEQVTTTARSLLTGDGIRFMYENVVKNFMNFNAVGVIIVAMLGVGVADSSGLVGASIRKLVLVVPRKALTYVLVFAGIVSSVAADAGYLVLVPLGATAFLSMGRHPLAGLAASFAGVAAVFSVNILIKPLDGILTEITNDAIHLVNPALSINLTANFWFSVASVLMLTFVVSLINDKLVEPRLGRYTGEKPAEQGKGLSPEESRGLKYATWALLAVIVLFALLTVPKGALLRNPVNGALIGNSPFMNGLIVAVTILFLAMGVAYGIGVGAIKSIIDVIKAMEKAIERLAGLIFLLFIISQFLALFNYSNIATVAAVKIGDALEHAGLGPLPLLVGFVGVTLVIGMIILGAIPKWAIFAPIFVPLLMRLHVQPEAVLAAYRVGDSPVNVISPLNAYFALIVSFAQEYQKSAGVGTIVALMLPYVTIVSIVWTLLLVAWQAIGLPWGL